MKKVFRRTLFVENCIREDIVREGIVSETIYKEALNTWTKWCDGMEVIDGYINSYIILDAWCEIIEE